MLARTRYAILGVTPTESPDGLRRVFRQLIKRYHPDRAGYGATGMFQQIIEAYRILERAEWRSRYDDGIADALRQTTAATPLAFTSADESETALPALVPTIDLRVMSLVELEMLAPRVSERLRQMKNSTNDEWGPVELSATLSADDAARGGVAVLDLPAWYPCGECGGTGHAGTAPCDACDGDAVALGAEQIRVRVPALSSPYMRLELPVPYMGAVGKIPPPSC